MSELETLAQLIRATPILDVDRADDAARKAYARAIEEWRQEAAQALAAIEPAARRTKQAAPALSESCDPRPASGAAREGYPKNSSEIRGMDRTGFHLETARARSGRVSRPIEGAATSYSPL